MILLSIIIGLVQGQIPLNCFEDLMPFIFATEGTDTRITAMDTHKTVNGVMFYIGGSTYDTQIVEDDTSTQKRAWIANHFLDKPDGNIIKWMRYFGNEAISEVVSIFLGLTTGANGNSYLYALLHDETSNEYYITLINKVDGLTEKQYVIKDATCTTA